MALSATYIGSAGDESGGGHTSFSIAAYNQAAGHLIVVFTSTFEGAGTVSSVTDTAGNTYVRVLAGQGEQNNSTNVFGQIWYAKNCLGNAANVVTVNYSASITFSWCAAVDVAGADTSSPLDTSAVNTGAASTSHTTGAYTTTSANEILFVLDMASNAGFSLNSINNGYSVDATVLGSGGLGHKIVSSIITAETTTVTASASVQFGTVVATFKAATITTGKGAVVVIME